MNRAFQLAATVSARSTSPNPRVGCVLVKNGKIIAQAAHQHYGKKHAEALALEIAGSKAKNATAYISLEPCVSFHGKKTPPCSEKIIASKIRSVYIASKDPDRRITGRGIKKLQGAGIKTYQLPEFTMASKELNRGFFSRHLRQRPWIILKSAFSIDGKTSATTGRSRWITGPPARAFVHQLRARVDAIAVGAGTVLTDNPQLTSHGAGPNPHRVIFQGKRALPKRLKVFDGSAPTTVYRTKSDAELRMALKNLAQKGIGTLLLEGGSTLHATFLRQNLIDEAYIFLSPKFLSGTKDPNRAPRLRKATPTRIGDDWLIQGTL